MWSGKYRRYLYGSTVNSYRNDYSKLTSSLLVFICPHGHTSFSLYRFSVTDSYWVFRVPSMSTLGTLIFSDLNALHWHSLFSFIVYPLLVFFDPCSMWQLWYNKWHIVSALIFSAFHVTLGHSLLSIYRLSVADSNEFFFLGCLSLILFWCFYPSLCFPNPIVVVITSNSRENWMWLLARLHHSIYGYSNQRGRNPDVGIVLMNYFPSVKLFCWFRCF